MRHVTSLYVKGIKEIVEGIKSELSHATHLVEFENIFQYNVHNRRFYRRCTCTKKKKECPFIKIGLSHIQQQSPILSQINLPIFLSCND